MSWGGARVGAGKKPKPKPEQPLSPFSVVSGGRTSAPDDSAELLEPPSDLPADQQAFWRAHAPLAIAKITLTQETVPAFRLLCELHAKKVIVGALIDNGALDGLRVFLQISKQVEGLMARFCLAPFGKPLKADKPKTSANPWGGFAVKK
jgi:hypothetical protein